MQIRYFYSYDICLFQVESTKHTTANNNRSNIKLTEQRQDN